MKQVTVPFSSLLAAILVVLVAVAVTVAGLPLGTALAGSLAQGAQPGQSQGMTNRTVQVSGSAVVNVVPDQAALQLGVQSSAATVAEVELANSAASQQVIAALHKLGIADRDIATDRYVVEPVYENYDSLRIRGYRINNVVGVTLRDVSLARPAISAALQAGANQVLDVSFYSSQLRQYRDQARDLAMKAAGEKAAALAQAAGTRTGSVLTISENSWSTFNGMWSRAGAGQMTQNVIQNVAAAGDRSPDDGPVSLGQISIRAEVAVTYSLD